MIYRITIARPALTRPAAMRLGVGTLLHDVHEDHAVRLTARVFTIRRLIGIVRQVEITELVHLPVLHATEAGEVRFGQVVGRAVVSALLDAVIDPVRIELGMQRIIGVGFIGADRRTFLYEPIGQADHVGLILGLDDERQGFACPWMVVFSSSTRCRITKTQRLSAF